MPDPDAPKPGPPELAADERITVYHCPASPALLRFLNAYTDDVSVSYIRADVHERVVAQLRAEVEELREHLEVAVDDAATADALRAKLAAAS